MKARALIALAALLFAGAAGAADLPLAINIGAAPNDKTGDGLRTAFGKTMSAVNALANARGAANGIATLDGSNKVPITQLPSSIGKQVSGRTYADPGLPSISAVLAGNVVPDIAGDQAPNIVAAVATAPSSGADVVLPCGVVRISSLLTIAPSNVRLRGGPGRCTTILITSDFTSGDVIRLAGDHTSLRDVAIIMEPSAASGQFPTRSAGVTVSLTGAFTAIEDVTLENCFVCVLMAPRLGYAIVDKVEMKYITPEATAFGSGGIRVDNPIIGPDNYISRSIISNDGRPPSTFAIALANTGATNINMIDTLGFRHSFLINPSSGKTVQATLVSNVFFDSAKGDNVLIQPTGSGYVFHTHFTNLWTTNTEVVGTNGVMIDGESATGLDGFPVKDTRVANSFVVSTTGQTGGGIVCNGPKSMDTTIMGTVVSGWGIGVNVGAGCSHVTLADNSIGGYSPFGLGSPTQTNAIGIALTAGASDWLSIHDNRLFANTNQAILNQSPTGTRIVLRDNLQ